MRLSDFLAGTFPGNIVLLGVFVGVPLLGLGIYENLQSGTLDLPMLLEMVVAIGGSSVAAGAMFWFSFARQLAKRKWPNGPPRT